MSQTKRDYRQHLSSKAQIFLDGKEIDCTIIDLSISGLKIKIHSESFSKSPKILVELISIGDKVDFSIQEMHFDGEVKIVRKELLENEVYLSISYDDIFFGLNHLPYHRQSYRTRHRSSGQILINEKNYDVISHDFSTEGMQLAIFEKLDLDVNSELEITFEQLNISGRSRLKWKQESSDQSLLGLEYIQLAAPVRDIASFVQH